MEEMELTLIQPSQWYNGQVEDMDLNFIRMRKIKNAISHFLDECSSNQANHIKSWTVLPPIILNEQVNERTAQ